MSAMNDYAVLTWLDQFTPRKRAELLAHYLDRDIQKAREQGMIVVAGKMSSLYYLERFGGNPMAYHKGIRVRPCTHTMMYRLIAKTIQQATVECETQQEVEELLRRM